MHCKSCGKEVNGNAIACPACGMDPKSGSSHCGACGTATNPGQKMCVKCGVLLKRAWWYFNIPFARPATQINEKDAKPISIGRHIAIALGVFIIGVFGIWLIWTIFFQVPVFVSFRQAVFGDGYVLEVRSLSTSYLRCKMTAHGRSDSFILNPGGALEFGWAQGHPFVPGDRFVISSGLFSDVGGGVN